MSKPAPKAPPEAVALYETLLATHPEIERKGATMPYTSVNGNMFSLLTADGTRSILDISTIGDEPDFGVASPLPVEMLESLYGTTQPTFAEVEASMEFLEDVERGHAVYVVCYTDGNPTELLFAGYSFD